MSEWLLTQDELMGIRRPYSELPPDEEPDIPYDEAVAKAQLRKVAERLESEYSGTMAPSVHYHLIPKETRLSLRKEAGLE